MSVTPERHTRDTRHRSCERCLGRGLCHSRLVLHGLKHPDTSGGPQTHRFHLMAMDQTGR